MLFFGYTNCPNVCPTILANLERARKTIGPRGADLVVALVTVDPKRDTPAELGRCVSVFDPSFLGLTGSALQLASVYRAYHVRFAKDASSTRLSGRAHRVRLLHRTRRPDSRLRLLERCRAILEESLRSSAG